MQPTGEIQQQQQQVGHLSPHQHFHSRELDSTTAERMPKAKAWKPQENAHPAEAWTEATEETGTPRLAFEGTGQRAASFWEITLAHLKKKRAPTVCIGTHHDQGIGPTKGHSTDRVARECRKFNKSLQKVFSSDPTGCAKEQKLMWQWPHMLARQTV